MLEFSLPGPGDRAIVGDGDVGMPFVGKGGSGIAGGGDGNDVCDALLRIAGGLGSSRFPSAAEATASWYLAYCGLSAEPVLNDATKMTPHRLASTCSLALFWGLSHPWLPREQQIIIRQLTCSKA